MESAGVSGTVTISYPRSYMKNETLRDKNPTEIHSALNEICGEFSLDCNTFSRWASRFRGSCVSIDNDPRSGTTRTSTDNKNVKLVADALEEDHRATCKDISRATGAKTGARKCTRTDPVARG